MSESYCHIDFTRSSREKLSIDRDYPIKEIELSTKKATFYFSVPKDDKCYALREDDDFVLLLNGVLYDVKIDGLLDRFKKDSVKDVLHGVDGLFTLLLYDKKREKLYSSRDYFGQLPFYYYVSNNVILYSNSLKLFKKSKIFKKEIDFDVLGQYFQHGYILEPNTIFANCFKVPSSHVLTWDMHTKKHMKKKYWDVASFYALPRLTLSDEEIINKSLELLSKAMRKQIGDREKVGLFLSGGYDSSALVSLASKIDLKTLVSYTMGFDDKKIDEVVDAKQIAEHLHVKHNSYYFSDIYLKELLKSFALVYDEPIADKAALPTMLISRQAYKDIDIIFGGEGGDEVFASAGIIKKLNFLNIIPFGMRLVASKSLRFFSKDTKYIKWSKILAQKNIENSIKYENITLDFSNLERLIKKTISKREIDTQKIDFNINIHWLDRLFPLVLKSYVSNNLIPKVTFATRYYNIESKSPYLDREFVEFLAQVDVKLKHKDGTNKYILKQILQKYLPLKLIDRPKKGFDVPVAKILKHQLRPFLDSYINYERIEKENILNPKEVMRLKEKFLNSNSYYDEQNIWNILIFELWYEEWFSE